MSTPNRWLIWKPPSTDAPGVTGATSAKKAPFKDEPPPSGTFGTSGTSGTGDLAGIPEGAQYSSIPADSQPAVLLEQDKLEQPKKEEQHGPSTVSIPAREPLPSLAWQDHSLWEEEFSTWALRDCVFRDGCFGSIAGLHRQFCEDCIARDTVPCRLPAFETLLIEEGFLFQGRMVAGLLLREDYESAMDFESRPSR